MFLLGLSLFCLNKLKGGEKFSQRSALLNSDAVWENTIAAVRANPKAMSELKKVSDTYLNGPTINIVDNKKHLAPGKNPHDYVSIAAYYWPDPKAPGKKWTRKDGYVNPDFYEYDNQKLEKLCQAVQNLVLYGRAANSEVHSRRAGILLRAWFIDAKTRMNPHLQYAQGIPGICKGRCFGIIDTTSLVFLLDAVSQLEFNQDWTPEHLAELKRWFSSYIDWLQKSSLGKQECATNNNHGTWYDAQIVVFAKFCDRTDLIPKQINKYTKKRIASQIKADGSQPHELKRTLGLTYTTYNLLALLCTARIGQDYGIELWAWKGKSGGSIKEALTWLIPYYKQEQKWKWKQVKAFPLSNAVLPLSLSTQISCNEKYNTLAVKLETSPCQRVIFSKASISARTAPGSKK